MALGGLWASGLPLQRDESRIENIQCFECARRIRSGPWREASYGNRQAGMEG